MAVNRKAALKRQRREVNEKFSKIMNRIKGPLTERSLTLVISSIATRAAYYTPQDTTALINSQFREVRKAGSGMKGIVGYTQNYAAALEDRVDWLPRAPADRPGRIGGDGKRYGAGTGAYNPNAKPGFLTEGADEAVTLDMPRLLLRGYKL